MDRKALKRAARESLAEAQGSPKKVTLICLIAVVVLLALEWGLTELVGRMSFGHNYLSQALSAETRSYVLMVVISLVCQFLIVLVMAGYCAFALRLSRKASFTTDVLLEGFRSWSRGILLYVYLSVLMGLWGMVFTLPVSYILGYLYLYGIASEQTIMSLMALTTVIAVFLASYRYRTAWFLFLDDPVQPLRLLVTKAKFLTRTHRLQLLALDLSFVPWLLLCALTCGVLLIWKLPYMAATYAHAYQAMLEDGERRREKLEQLRKEQQQWIEHRRTQGPGYR